LIEIGKSIENSECPYDRHIPFDIPYRIPGMIEKSGCDLMIFFCSSDFPVPSTPGLVQQRWRLDVDDPKGNWDCMGKTMAEILRVKKSGSIAIAS
jgi:hypothetical protein